VSEGSRSPPPDPPSANDDPTPAATDAPPREPSAPPPIPPAARRRIRDRVLLALALPFLLLTLPGAALAWTREAPATAWGLLVGHATGLVVIGSWTLGAIAAWGASDRRFLGLTVGMWPVRLGAVAVVCFAAPVLGLDTEALVGVLLLAVVYGEVLLALTGTALTRAARLPAPDQRS